MGYKVGAEIGVYRGRNAGRLYRWGGVEKLYCIDSWAGKYACHEEPARIHLAQYPGIEILKGNSLDIAKTFKDGSLDFVYIDANHTYESVKEDLRAWFPKVREGGLMEGHDYQMEEVKRAIDEFVGKDYKFNVTWGIIPSNWFFTK